MKELEMQYHIDLINIYDLLRESFFNQFKKETIENIQSLSLNIKDNFKDDKYIKSLNTVNDSELDEFRWEYNRLFVGPKKPIAVPFESVYRSEKQLFMREETFKVREFYEEIGIEVEMKNKFPDDFIGFELQYLLYVSHIIVQLLEEGKSAKDYILLRKEFLDKHVNMWVYDFCDDISNNTKYEIWNSLSLLLRNVLDMEKKYLNDYINNN